MIGQCALCQKTKELKESHVIPRFIGKWLKDTSATGYMRQALNPNLRAQDFPKSYFLCGDCEQIFGKEEKTFAEKIFIPFQEGKKLFAYDKWLIRFIISLNWRLATKELDEPSKCKLSDSLKSELQKALEIWRGFLHEDKSDYGSYKHHIFFFDTIKSASERIDVPEKPNWYLLRSVDATIVRNSKSVFVYSKLPGIMIVSHVYPTNMIGWRSTRVFKRGTIKIPQACEVPGIGDFLFSRMSMMNQLSSQITEVQQQKIGETLKKNPERMEQSKSIEVFKADELFRK